LVAFFEKLRDGQGTECAQRLFEQRVKQFGHLGRVRVSAAGRFGHDVVTVEGDLLTIKGRREEEKEVKEENYYCSERAFGEFSRTVRLPEGAATDAIEATCSNGILEVAIPKPASPEVKSVKVQVK